MNIKFKTFTLLLLVCSSCSAQIKLIGNYVSHFNDKQLKEIRLHFDRDKIMKEMVVGAIVVNDSQEIGLYKFMLYKQQSSVNPIYKVLKFKNKITYYSKNVSENEKILLEFENEYKDIFTLAQLKKIRESFLKGNEVAGRVM